MSLRGNFKTWRKLMQSKELREVRLATLAEQIFLDLLTRVIDSSCRAAVWSKRGISVNH